MSTLLRTYRTYGAGLALAALLIGSTASAKPAQSSANGVATTKRGASANPPSAPSTKASKSAGKKRGSPQAQPTTASVDWVPAESVDEYFRN